MGLKIGFDIGGTKIASAVFSADGKILSKTKMDMPKEYDSFLGNLVSTIKNFENEHAGISNIGIVIRGSIDREQNCVAVSHYASFLEGKKVASDLADLVGLPVRMANDANGAAMAEAHRGAGKGHDVVFYVTVGTGIGGALIVNGKLIEGRHGWAGEIGQLPLPFRDERDGPVVDRGQWMPDRIEECLGGPALARRYEAATGKKAEGAQIVALARQGDKGAIEVVDAYYESFAKAMTVVLHTVDPDIVVIGGGMSTIAELYDEIPKRLPRYALSPKVKTPFVPAALGEDSALFGAYYL
jgi:fructokinase